MSKVESEIYNDSVIPEKGIIQEKKRNHSFFEELNHYFNNGLALIAGTSMVLMMLVVVGNVIVRTFSTPFVGTTEVAGWLLAVTTSFALGYTQLNHGHVAIDLIVNKFSPIIQKGILALIYLGSLLFFLVVGWHLVKYGVSLMGDGSLSETLGIIYFPFVIVTSLGFFGTSLALSMQFYENVKRGVIDGE